MRFSSKKGSASFEMVFFALILATFATLSLKFYALARVSHSATIDAENMIEVQMQGSGRPPCLEKIGTGRERIFAGPTFAGSEVERGIIYYTRPICTGGEN